MARRSTASAASSVGAPCTWLRKPSSTCLSARVTPDLASRRLASTSCVLLPMDETMPIPVTTTRLMPASSASCGVFGAALRRRRPYALRGRAARSGAARRQRGALLEKSDLEVERLEDDRAVRRDPAVGNAEHQPRAHHPLDVDPVHHF